MQAVRSRSAYSRFKDRKKSRTGLLKPLSRSMNVLYKSRDRKKELRDLVEHRFMKMDEAHSKIRDQFLGGPPRRYE